jgi:hypothetical protein
MAVEYLQTQDIPTGEVQVSERSITKSNICHSLEQHPRDDEEIYGTQLAENVALQEGGGGIWGFLHPCSPAVSRVYFLKPQTIYTLGRDSAKVDIVLRNRKISKCLTDTSAWHFLNYFVR